MRNQAFFLLGVSISNVVLATVILFRNVRNLTNIFFATLNLAAAAWAGGLAAFIFSNSSKVATMWAREYYTAAALIAFSFLLFSVTFTGNFRGFGRKHLMAALIPLLVILGLIFSKSGLLMGIAYHD